MFLFPLIKITPKVTNYLSNKLLDPNKKSIIILICISAGYIFTFTFTILVIPSNVIYGDLSPKPNLTAHRGASSLTPEKIIEACIATIDYNAVV